MKQPLRFRTLITSTVLVASLLVPQLALMGSPDAAVGGAVGGAGAADGGVKGGGLSLDKLKAGLTGSVGPNKAFPKGADADDIFKIANGVILTFFTLLALIFLVMMLYGGYNWMTAMGDDEKVTKAKDTIIASVIGVIILISGYAITTFIITNIYGNVAS